MKNPQRNISTIIILLLTTPNSLVLLKCLNNHGNTLLMVLFLSYYKGFSIKTIMVILILWIDVQNSLLLRKYSVMKSYQPKTITTIDTVV